MTTDTTPEPEAEIPEEADATVDLISELATAIGVISEAIGVLEFWQGFSEDDSEGKNLFGGLEEDDAKLLVEANAAVELALEVIGYGHDGDRRRSISVIRDILKRYAERGDKPCDDCRKKAMN